MHRIVLPLLAALALGSACASSEEKPDQVETQAAQGQTAEPAPEPARELPATPPPPLEKKDSNKMERSGGDDE